MRCFHSYYESLQGRHVVDAWGTEQQRDAAGGSAARETNSASVAAAAAAAAAAGASLSDPQVAEYLAGIAAPRSLALARFLRDALIFDFAERRTVGELAAHEWLS